MNLKTIGAAAVPTDLASTAHKTLAGTFVLQLESLRDCTCSSTQETSGFDPIPFFHLTDGHTTVAAVQFKPSPLLESSSSSDPYPFRRA